MGELSQALLAISAGAVFMGANTYIGNAPNFMVKSIAESSGIEMPSLDIFYSLIILFLLFGVISLLFFKMRISKVTTKSGDKGKTSLGNGDRVSKSNAFINLLGDIDELNSHLGSAVSTCRSDTIWRLASIQQDLFNLGGEVSMPNSGTQLVNESRIVFLEDKIDEFNQSLKPLKEFILPGGDEFCSRIHIARSVCVEQKDLALKLLIK